jgi:hypothetical protein
MSDEYTELIKEVFEHLIAWCSRDHKQSDYTLTD